MNAKGTRRMSTRGQRLAEAFGKVDIGTHVAVRDAYGDIHRAVIAEVPQQWRDSSRRRDFTIRGDFPKRWVHFVDKPVSADSVPWPIEDVLTKAVEAEERAEST